MREVNAGIPFFDDVNKQLRNKPYFNAYSEAWICPKNRLPSFQFITTVDDLSVTDFDLIELYTGTTTSYLTHFNSYATNTALDITRYFTYVGENAVSLTPGMYYLYAKTTEGREYWSEIFKVTELEDGGKAAEIRFIDIGLPFFDDINEQVSKKPYFTTYYADWLSAANRFPAFQINVETVSGMNVFNLVNSETGVTADYLSHFNSNTILTLVGSNYYYTYLGNAEVSVESGRYYFVAESTSGRYFWSEEFVMCGDVTEQSDFLMLDLTDYLLIGGTDKLKLN